MAKSEDVRKEATIQCDNRKVVIQWVLSTKRNAGNHVQLITTLPIAQGLLELRLSTSHR